jgi:two-component system cell cycle sensor histidine kinase/response regulator CckA
VNADPGRIEQVIMNLAVNSRDAMPNGGLLAIRTGAARLSAEELTAHPEVVPGEYVSLSVRDTGNGMDAQTMSRLFEPFFTTKEVGKGTGLGLATVYGIVRQSSGHITCDSEPGKGATFTVYLPRVKRRPPGVGGSVDGSVRAASGTGRILLVEDDLPVRRYVGSILETAGYTVIAAESGHDALGRLGSLPQPPDLLLTDVVMPGMDGRVLAQEVARRLPGVPVVFMSGYSDVMPGVPDLTGSDSVLIQKPFSSVDLLEKIRSSLEKHGKRD